VRTDAVWVKIDIKGFVHSAVEGLRFFAIIVEGKALRFLYTKLKLYLRVFKVQRP